MWHILILPTLQKANNGIAMVNFYPPYINCTNPDDATVEQVAGIYNINYVAK